MYACSLGDVRVLFLEKGESRHATALRGARSRFEGPIGSFSMYVCGLGDVRAFFSFMVSNLHVCDCILVLRMVLLL